MPLARMGDGLGYPRLSRASLTFRAILGTLPRLDPTQYGLADYSFYEGFVNYSIAKQNGLAQPVIRVGQGYYGTDPQFKASSANSKSVFPLRDFYWMLDTHQSANGQAVACAGLIANFGQPDPDSILWADFELAPVNASFLWGFLSTMQTLLPTLKLGIYTGYSYWATYGSTDPKYSFQQFPLWISWPVIPYIPPRPLAPWGSNWMYHQWTYNGDGKFYGASSTSLDLNYKNPNLVPNTPPTPGGTVSTQVTVKTGQIANLKDMKTGVLLHTAVAGETIYGTRSAANTDVIGFVHYYTAAGVQTPLAVTDTLPTSPTYGAKVSITGSNVTVTDGVTEPGTPPPPPPPAGDTATLSAVLTVTHPDGTKDVYQINQVPMPKV